MFCVLCYIHFSADSSERTERLSKEQVMKLTSAHLRSSLTLREMLDLGKNCLLTEKDIDRWIHNIFKYN